MREGSDPVVAFPMGYREGSYFSGVSHVATLYGEELYIWCYGMVHPNLWAISGDLHAVATCLRCAVAEPRGEWQSDMPGRPRYRRQMMDGNWVVTYDTETHRGPLPNDIVQSILTGKRPR